MPFDQFTIEQLAGDLLPERDARPAHRHRLPPQHDAQRGRRHRPAGVSLPRHDRPRGHHRRDVARPHRCGCAQCHTHKYDPITHREYFQLMAFLNNADEPDLDLPAAGRRSAGKRTRRSPRSSLADCRRNGAKPARNTDASRCGRRSTQICRMARAERARAVRWTPLRPARRSRISRCSPCRPTIHVGERRYLKSDTYELHFRDVPRGRHRHAARSAARRRLPGTAPA